MLNASTHRHFTSCSDAQAEELLDQVLSEIGKQLETSGLSVYLGGSYGRGEGGVRLDREHGILYNDLDFFVFARQKVRRADGLLKEIAHRYEQQLNVDVDFSNIADVRDIKKNRKRLMMQELKRGYRLLCGEDLLQEHLPELPAEELPFSEACRLLLNRGMGLLFARQKIAEASGDNDFILRNINKAILASGDARLMVDGTYRWRIRERCDMILSSDMSASWKALYEQAVEFKSRPCQSMPEDMAAFLEQVQAFYNESLLYISNVQEPEQLPEGIWKKCRNNDELSCLNFVKYCVKTREVHFPNRFLFMPPVSVVLCRLYGRTSIDDQLYNHWLIFN